MKAKNTAVVPVVAGTPVATVPVAPVAKLTLAGAKALFVSSLTGLGTAKAKVTEAFTAAVPLVIGDKRDKPSKIKLHDTLIEWATSAGVEKRTAGNIVSDLMKKADMSIRKRGSKGAKYTTEEQAAAQGIIETLQETCEDIEEMTKVLRCALELAKKAEPTEAEAEEAPVAEAKAA